MSRQRETRTVPWNGSAGEYIKAIKRLCSRIRHRRTSCNTTLESVAYHSNTVPIRSGIYGNRSIIVHITRNIITTLSVEIRVLKLLNFRAFVRAASVGQRLGFRCNSHIYFRCSGTRGPANRISVPDG